MTNHLTCPVVHDPEEAGVATEHPELAQLEGAHLLANEAMPFLVDCGFNETQVLHWAQTYIAREGSGSVETFVDWLHEMSDDCPPR